MEITKISAKPKMEKLSQLIVRMKSVGFEEKIIFLAEGISEQEFISKCEDLGVNVFRYKYLRFYNSVKHFSSGFFFDNSDVFVDCFKGSFSKVREYVEHCEVRSVTYTEQLPEYTKYDLMIEVTKGW